MSELTLATWPRPQDSLILTAARTVLHAIAQADAQADGQVDAGADPDPGLVALRARLGPITPQRAAAWPVGDGTRRVLVEYDDFVSGIITRYEAALVAPPASGTDPHGGGGNAAAERPLQDSPNEFRGFASKDFSRFKAFVIRWIEKAAAPAADVAPDSAGPTAGPIRILVPRSLLLADPGPWLDHALSSLDLRLAADPAALAALRDRAMVWLAALPPQALPPDPAAFRHYETELFAQIGRLNLRRDATLGTFRSVMGRDLEEKNVLRFQTFPDKRVLRQSLVASVEYQRKLNSGTSAARAAAAKNAKDIAATYQLLLGRDPDATETAMAGSRFHTTPALRNHLLASAEFAAIYQSVENGRAIDDPVTLIHIHIPKTAGTSLNTILNRNFPQENILELHSHEINVIYEMSAEKRREIRVIKGHLTHGFSDVLPQKAIYLCVLRQPGPRLFSFYRFVQRNVGHPLHQTVNDQAMSFGDFLEFSVHTPALFAEFDNGQMRRISGEMDRTGKVAPGTVYRKALRNLLAPDMRFGLTEHFDALVYALVAEKLLTRSDIVKQNVAPPGPPHADVVAALTADQRAIHDRYCVWDNHLYAACEVYLFGPDPKSPHQT